MGVTKKLNNLLCAFLPESNKWYRENTALCLRTVAHAAMLAHHTFISVYGTTTFKPGYLDEQFRIMETYAPVLLTAWNMLFQTVFLCFAVWYDCIGWLGKKDTTIARRVRQCRHTIFTALVVPFTVFVCSCFWTLFLLDREQVFPKSLDEVVPSWFNHGVHTCVLLTILLELVLQPMREPEDHTALMLLSTGASVFYAVCYYWVYFRSGCWLYPVFGLMTWWQICLFQLAIWLSMHLFYRMQWPISKFIHGTIRIVSANKESNKYIINNNRKETDVRVLHPEDYFKNNDLTKEKFGHECSKCVNKCIEFCACG